MTPSWWIPEACRKALAPTMALLGWTGKPVMSLTRRARAIDLPGVDVGGDAEGVAAGLDGHDDLFEGGVARALAEAVDAALHLPGTLDDGRDAVRRGIAEVVVAVDADDGLVDVGDVLLDEADALGELGRQGVPDGIGDVHGGRAGIDAGLQHPIQVLDVGAGGVHRRELDVVAEVPRALDGGDGLIEHLFGVLAQEVHQVAVGARYKGVDAGTLGSLDGLPCVIYVAGDASRQRRDGGRAHLFGDCGHGLEVAGRACGEPGLDDVHAEALKLPGNLHLLIKRQADPRRLLAVSQRGVEDQYVIFGGHGRFSPIRQVFRKVRPFKQAVRGGHLRVAQSAMPSPARTRQRRRTTWDSSVVRVLLLIAS